MAIEYFKEAAYANYTDGQYNYGVTLLKNDKDKELGMNFINLAAMQGHTLAMFHLGKFNVFDFFIIHRSSPLRRIVSLL